MTTSEAFEELDLSDGREATVARQYGYDEQLGCIKVEKPNGDIDAISRLTRDDAIALIGALQRAFDIPDRAAELELLLEMREETTLNIMEKSVMAGIANIMYENGLKRATITPQNVMSGFVPSLSIDVSVPGVVIYTLNGEPLNGKPDTE
ncbi:hypothetical protein [Klebsiella pneumoniae]|uniref:hypothetical protein n=1 Tax=Klebsiella pneumoniae TaxID=573 RepID=UPI0027310713|nr:hypothetical protein [Klebsiella pneumoniae]MDP1287636.1 hypothetical protein [Klebsiella pneumoniae]